MSDSDEYSEGICGNGAAILRNGLMMPISHIVEKLNKVPEYEARIAELEKSQEWVSVEDRLPEEGQFIVMLFECYSPIAKWYKADMDNSFFTHWLPLPTRAQ